MLSKARLYNKLSNGKLRTKFSDEYEEKNQFRKTKTLTGMLTVVVGTGKGRSLGREIEPR